MAVPLLHLKAGRCHPKLVSICKKLGSQVPRNRLERLLLEILPYSNTFAAKTTFEVASQRDLPQEGHFV